MTEGFVVIVTERAGCCVLAPASSGASGEGVVDDVKDMGSEVIRQRT